MNYLLIDTSSSFVLVSIISDGRVIELFNEEITDDISSNILPIIDNCLKKSNISLKDINKIFVVNGPGSFTGVRIGVTIAKIMSWSLNIDLIPLSSLELLATSSSNSKIIPMINARRGNVFAAIYDNNLNILLEEKIYNLSDLVKEYGDLDFVSYDKFENIKTIKPHYDIMKIIKKHENDLPINAHKLVPNYLKKTEAEENLYDKGV